MATARTLLPVAQYIRMSTEHQRYSADNQAAAIEIYAAAHEFEIVQTYADLGRSGLTLDRRPALQQLLADVARGNTPYRVVLIYDVSRWGRFQDPDESAYHEHACKRAGVAVHYCAEPFENDGTVIATILKSLKRAMAAEYSRELSQKVFEAQRRAASLGYSTSHWVPLATRRMLVDASGHQVRLLAPGESNQRGHRVALVPGPRVEPEWVRRAFSLYGRLGWTLSRIATSLNEAGLSNPQGSRWTYSSVRNLLRSEIYIGNIVYGRTKAKLGGPMLRVDPSEWTRGEGVIAPIVSRKIFDEVQFRLTAGERSTDKSMLASLAALFAEHGHLSTALIDRKAGMPSAATYAQRFGSLPEAYRMVGYYQTKWEDCAAKLKATREYRTDLCADVVEALRSSGHLLTLQASRSVITVDNRFLLQGARDRGKISSPQKTILDRARPPGSQSRPHARSAARRRQALHGLLPRHHERIPRIVGPTHAPAPARP